MHSKTNVIYSLLNEIGKTDVDWTDVEVTEKMEYTLVEVSGMEYYIMNEEQANDYIRNDLEQETAQYFNSSFLAGETGLPEQVFTALVDSRGGNDAVIQLIEKTCGLDEFVESAVSMDGYGHFIAGYDHNQIDLDDDYMAFRIN